MKNLLSKWRKNTEPLVLEEILPSGKEEVVSDVLKEQYKKIAEFMGYFYVPSAEINPKLGPGWYWNRNPKDGFICRNTKKLNFKYDWQILMRVVLKIESLKSQRYGGFKVTIVDDCCTIQAHLKKENTYSKTYCSSTKINSVYESVVLFIDWYNTNELTK